MRPLSVGHSTGRFEAYSKQNCPRRGGKTLFGYLQPGVKKVFDIVKAVDLSTVFASVAELDDYLDAIQKQLAD